MGELIGEGSWNPLLVAQVELTLSALAILKRGPGLAFLPTPKLGKGSERWEEQK